ncbi:hypothetical protein [Leifsonia poae]|uniref:hypothetical protein n=1 Tax=Leifsonia poae TaxID=110933 RepID=UPI001CC1280C|nr:hypothetical protein [Leifsonia poae]
MLAAVRSLAGRHPAPVLASFTVVCALAWALVAWLRLPAIARDTLWAEDGRTFLQAAGAHGLLNTLFVPYAGYLHLVPRILAGLVVLLPVDAWAIGMTAGSCLVAGFLAAVVFVCARDIVPWLPARLLVASLTVLAPLAPREVLGNAANVHSLFLWALLWMLLYRPRTQRGAVALGVIALVASFTEIQSLLLLPLLVLRPREPLRWIVRAGLLLGLFVQVVVTLAWPRAHPGNPPVPLLSELYGYLINAVTPLAVPQTSIGPLIAAWGPAVGLVILVALTPAVIFAVMRGRRERRFAVVALVAGSLVCVFVDLTTNPNSFYDYASMTQDELRTVWLMRYGVVPSMMLAATVPIAASLAWERRAQAKRAPAKRAQAKRAPVKRVPGSRAPRRLGSGASLPGALAVSSCLLLAVLLLAQVGPQPTRRSGGPAWQPQVTAARSECIREPELDSVVLRETLGWHVVVDCSRLSPLADPD